MPCVVIYISSIAYTTTRPGPLPTASFGFGALPIDPVRRYIYIYLSNQMKSSWRGRIGGQELRHQQYTVLCFAYRPLPSGENHYDTRGEDIRDADTRAKKRLCFRYDRRGWILPTREERNGLLEKRFYGKILCINTSKPTLVCHVRVGNGNFGIDLFRHICSLVFAASS